MTAPSWCWRWIRAIALLIAVVSSRTEAQGARVHGVAFDSLSGSPFVGALVVVRGTSRSVFTDQEGRFVFDSLPRGRVQIDLSAASIDRLGFDLLTRELELTADSSFVALTMPSFPTLANRLCGTSVSKTGEQTVLIGTVRDARDNRMISKARVEAVANDVVATAVRETAPLGVLQRTWSGTATSDESGRFALCGLPENVAISLSAANGDLGMGTLVTSLASQSISRYDLWLARLDDSSSVGIVQGTVTDEESLQPVANVQVTVSGAEPVRTDSHGKFVVPRSPLGTREVEFRRIGTEPVHRTVGVRSGVPSIVDIPMRRVSTLTTMSVHGVSIRQQRILDMERRRELNLGWFADSTQMLRYPDFAAITRSISGRTGFCAIYVDGVRQPPENTALQDYKPYMIAQLEVHLYFTPIEFRQKRQCPVLLLWTKLGLP